MSIRLSDKYGVNPAIPKCFYCYEDKNELLMAGKLPGDKEAPKNCVWDMEPCEACQELMKQGIILISIKDGEEENCMEQKPIPNPYRTGGFVVARPEFFTYNLSRKAANYVLEKRWLFIPDSVWKEIGLPVDHLSVN